MGGQIYSLGSVVQTSKRNCHQHPCKAREGLGSIRVGSEGGGGLSQTTCSGFSSASVVFLFFFKKET